jgi:hypothetical protein
MLEPWQQTVCRTLLILFQGEGEHGNMRQNIGDVVGHSEGSAVRG